MSFKNFFHISYWFQQPDPAMHGVRIFWIVFFLIFVVGGIALLVVKAMKQEKAVRLVVGRYASAFITLGITGLLWFVFRQENVSILSYRFWMAIWVVTAGLWLGSIISYTVRRIPAIKAENKERELREKYLPKPKR